MIDRDGLDEAMDRINRELSKSLVGMLMWVDPTGQKWIAPLGSPTPDADRPVPPQWVKIRIVPRDETDAYPT